MEMFKAKRGRCALARQKRVTSDVLLSFLEGSRVLLVSSLKYQKQPCSGLEDCVAFVGDFKVHLLPCFACFVHESL